MKNLQEYINSKKFETIRLYTGLSGQPFEIFKQKEKQVITALKERLKSARYMQKIKLQEKIDDRQYNLELNNYPIINSNGELHETTQLIKEFNVNQNAHNHYNQFIHILNNSHNSDIATPCIPIYRNAIALISKTVFANKIEGIVHICFECFNMKNEMEQPIGANAKTYELLRPFFNSPSNDNPINSYEKI